MIYFKGRCHTYLSKLLVVSLPFYLPMTSPMPHRGTHKTVMSFTFLGIMFMLVRSLGRPKSCLLTRYRRTDSEVPIRLVIVVPGHHELVPHLCLFVWSSSLHNRNNLSSSSCNNRLPVPYGYFINKQMVTWY